MEKELRKEKHEKKRPFVPVGNTNRDKRVRQPRGAGSTFCPGYQTRELCPGLTFSVGKSGQQKFPNRNKLAFM